VSLTLHGATPVVVMVAASGGHSATSKTSSADRPPILVGDTGKNALIGEGGNDLLKGGDGNDYLIGGIGLDRLWVRQASTFSLSTRSRKAARIPSRRDNDFSQLDQDRINLSQTMPTAADQHGNQTFTFIGSDSSPTTMPPPDRVRMVRFAGASCKATSTPISRPTSRSPCCT